jgi:phenylacetate-CoA ligase
MRRMEKVTGRSDDMMILRGVNVFPTQIEEQLMKVPQLAAHFQIELVKKGPMDHMIVHVEGDRAAGDSLATLIKANIGITAEVRAGADNSVARSQGKAVRVIDNRAAR